MLYLQPTLAKLLSAFEPPYALIRLPEIGITAKSPQQPNYRAFYLFNSNKSLDKPTGTG